jgi:hypothetical protein
MDWIHLAQDNQWQADIVTVSCSWPSMLITRHHNQFCFHNPWKTRMSTVRPQHSAENNIPYVQTLKGNMLYVQILRENNMQYVQDTERDRVSCQLPNLSFATFSYAALCQQTLKTVSPLISINYLLEKYIL